MPPFALGPAAQPAIADPRLRPFLEATDEEGARTLLGDLLMTEASPVLWRVIRSRLDGLQRAALEDVHADALLRLTRLFGAQRTGAPPIENLTVYSAAVGANACREFLRIRFPARSRLARQLRYLLSHDPKLALWQISSGSWIGGLRGWVAHLPHERAAEALRAAAEEPHRLIPGRQPTAARLGEVVRALLMAVGGPCPLDALTESLATVLGVRDLPYDGEPNVGEGRTSVAPDPSAEDRLADAEYLARLWGEVEALPRRQRAALLLNLRDASGRDMLKLVTATGMADLRHIAAMLEVSTVELETLLPELPREDSWIAEWLGLTRRQVINLRKCARERLGRRLRGL